MDQILALAKWVLSYRKRDWTIDDYPVRLHEQDADPRWWASIVNWPGPTGLGDTPAAARADLAAKLDGIASEDGLPRPGTRQAVRYADTDSIDAHRPTVDRLIAEVFELPWAFVSDQSRLHDFTDGDEDEAVARYQQRIRDVFDVDVSHIESGNIAEIAAFIDDLPPTSAASGREP